MKNLVSLRYIIGTFAIVAISLTGMLLAQQPADATGATGWIEMEANDRNYDWGTSKPTGDNPEGHDSNYAENRHRSIFEDEFQVHILQDNNRFNIKINVPRPWSYFRKVPFVTLNYNVEYEIEEAYHRTVSNPSDCSPVSAQTNTPIPLVVGSLEQVESTITLKDADLAANVGLYSCVIVRLKGNITGGGLLSDSDMHPEWAFASPVQITQPANWPEVIVVSDEQSIRIYSLAGASGLRFHFKYRILNEGDQCDASAFAVAPNHLAVHRSAQFNIPDSPEARANYHNRYVCFQATIINIDHDAYARGAYVYRYRNVPIDS